VRDEDLVERAGGFGTHESGEGKRVSLRILLVDDHHMIREGLRALLAKESGFEVVGEAADGRTALSLVRSLSPAVVVMDIEMPELNGIDAARQIKAEHEHVKVIALSMHFDRRHVINMVDAGVVAFVPKMEAYDELVRALRAVSTGRTYLSPDIAGFVLERFAQEKQGNDASAFSRLSTREREVLQLLAEGKSSLTTAKLMHISIKTVETHRRNIVRKLGVHGTAELTKYAVREGLTSLDF
jgi:DNA-binding NarL/FixJ family response regulator